MLKSTDYSSIFGHYAVHWKDKYNLETRGLILPAENKRLFSFFSG